MRWVIVLVCCIMTIGCINKTNEINLNKDPKQPVKAVQPIKPVALVEHDRAIIYKGFRIDKDTKIREMIKKIGKGNFQERDVHGNYYFSYPEKYSAFTVVTKDYKTIDSMQIYDIKTSKGLKIGDWVTTLYKLYGKPNKIVSEKPDWYWFEYNFKDSTLSIGSEDKKAVDYIDIFYK